MKAFIERVYILFQIICYSALAFSLYTDLDGFRTGLMAGEDIWLGLKGLLILVPTGIRWMLTGKFQILPITSDD